MADIAYRLTDDWELNLFIPWDWKDQEVEFELPDGSKFDNPAGEIHHRDELFTGFGDLELKAHYLGLEDFRVTVGFSIPTGNIESDPFVAGAEGRRHQHIQFGTGTIDPIIGLAYRIQGETFGLGASVGARIPLYENRNDYKGPTTVDFAIGPSVILTEWFAPSVQYVFQWQSRAFWDGDSDENSGYALHGTRLSLPFVLSEIVTMRWSILFVHDIDLRDDSDGFDIDWIGGLALDFRIAPEKASEPDKP